MIRGDAIGDFFAGFDWPIGQVEIDRTIRTIRMVLASVVAAGLDE